MAPTLLLLAGYLVLTVPPLLAGGHGAAGWAGSVGHLAAAALLVRWARGSAPGALGVRAWLPVLLVPVLYTEIRWLNQWAGPGFRDAVVQGWEAAVFPSNPSAAWAGAFPSRLASEAFHLGYLAYYPLIYLPQLRSWLRGDAERFHRMTLAVMLAFVSCYVAFVVFPVQGPRYLWTPAAPDGPVRAATLALLETGSSRGAAFPSSHVAVATAQAFMVVRFRMAEAWVVVPAAVLLTLGTVYGGFHYGVDALAGVAVGVAAGVIALRVPRTARRLGAGRAEAPSPGPGRPVRSGRGA